jgi:hypothetical protein
MCVYAHAHAHAHSHMHISVQLRLKAVSEQWNIKRNDFVVLDKIAEVSTYPSRSSSGICRLPAMCM